MIRWALLAALAVAVAAGLWFMTFGSQGDGVDRPDMSDPELIALGEARYAEHCASCHGAELEGEPNWRSQNADGTLPAPPHDATGHTWHHPDRVLFAITKQGGQALAPDGFESAMPAFGGALSDREIWAVLAYIKSRWPAEIRERQERISGRAE